MAFSVGAPGAPIYLMVSPLFLLACILSQRPLLVIGDDLQLQPPMQPQAFFVNPGNGLFLIVYFF